MRTVVLLLFFALSIPAPAEESFQPIAANWFDRPASTPTGLNRTYDALMNAFYLGKTELIRNHCLSGSVNITDDKRRPMHTGDGINLRFLSDGFSNLVVHFDVNTDETVRVRTRTSILHFVRTADKSWKLYKYRDEPLEK